MTTRVNQIEHDAFVRTATLAASLTASQVNFTNAVLAFANLATPDFAIAAANAALKLAKGNLLAVQIVTAKFLYRIQHEDYNQDDHVGYSDGGVATIQATAALAYAHSVLDGLAQQSQASQAISQLLASAQNDAAAAQAALAALA